LARLIEPKWPKRARPFNCGDNYVAVSGRTSQSATPDTVFPASVDSEGIRAILSFFTPNYP
jgi:hypothetical protein